ANRALVKWDVVVFVILPDQFQQCVGVRHRGRLPARFVHARFARVHPRTVNHVRRTGKWTVTVVSFPGSDATSMVPPCAVTIHCAMLKPSPHPSTALLCEGSPRKKRSNTRG